MVQFLVCLTVALKKPALEKEGCGTCTGAISSWIHTVALFAHHLTLYLKNIKLCVCELYTAAGKVTYLFSHIPGALQSVDYVIVQVWLADGFSVSVLTCSLPYLQTQPEQR